MQKEKFKEKDYYNYHYSREDRLAKNPELEKLTRGKKGWLRGNKGLIIILIDIFVIILIFVFVFPFVSFGNRGGEIEGYHFSVKAFSFGEDVLISLRTLNKKNERVTQSDNLFDAVIKLGSNELKEIWILPEPGEEQIYRTRMANPERLSALKVEINYKGKKIVISSSIKKE